MLEQFMRTAARGKDSCWRSSWENVQSPPPEGEGVAETECDELTTASIPHPLVLLQGEEVEKMQ